jgi:hypothetical protein
MTCCHSGSKCRSQQLHRTLGFQSSHVGKAAGDAGQQPARAADTSTRAPG